MRKNKMKHLIQNVFDHEEVEKMKILFEIFSSFTIVICQIVH